METHLTPHLTNNDMEEMKFDVKHLENPHWKPTHIITDFDKRQMEIWQNAEKEVLYSNVIVDYESCDCGGEYGCKHGSYWHRIRFMGHKASIDEEEGRLLIDGENGYYMSVPYENMTMGQFAKCCDICGIILSLKYPPCK